MHLCQFWYGHIRFSRKPLSLHRPQGPGHLAVPQSLELRLILDIGSGTGLIALMVAQRNQKALITALEIEPESFLQMQHNFNISSWKDRIQAVLVDFQNFESDILFDCIISNPPFYDDGNTNPDVQRSVARHTHSLPYSILMQKSASLLSNEGEFNVVIPYENEESIIKLAQAHQLFLTSTCRL